jgi:gliding motility-associated-like protein
MRKFLFLLISLCFFSVAQSQEICNNAIDDDADGLVDLNDPDCSCGSTSIPSMIPNPSFDTMACCPTSYSQANCAQGWVQASSATSDYMNTCGFVFGAATAAGLVPFPNGNGILGCIFMPNWQEYVGSCLSSPMIAGTQYTVQMNIASTPCDGQGGQCNGGVIDYGNIDIVIYGSPNCSDLPFASSVCPPAPWQVLGLVNYNPQTTWGTISITFTPSVNINAIIIGSPCILPTSYLAPPSGCYPYFYFDNILLNTSSSFSAITQAGSFCSNNFQLTGNTSPGATYQWYLNGVAIIGETNPLLDISANSYGPGNYTYVVTTGQSCASAGFTVNNSTQPTAAFTATSVCTGATAQFTDGSSAPSGSITSWQWDFGDPSSAPNNTSTLPSPSHVFSSSGTYSVTLIVTANNGCTDTLVIPVTVSPAPVANAGNDQTMCSGNPPSVTLTATGGGTYVWNGGSLFNTPGATQNVSPPVTTTYVVTVTNSSGCSTNDTVVVLVNQGPQFTAGADASICAGDTIQLNATGTGTFAWSPSTGLSNPAISNPQAFPSTTTTYTTTLTDANGCIGTDMITITVNTTPVAVASNDTTICAGNTVNLTSSGGSTYSWSPSGSLNNPAISNPVASPVTTTTYVVTVANGNCTDLETVVVNVQTVTATASPDVTICEGQSTQLTSSGGVSYSWSPSTGLDNPNIANPVAAPAVTTTYTLTITNGVGCTDVEVVTVTVTPSPSASFTATPMVIYVDSTYYFTDNSTGGVTSWMWYFGDGNTSTAQNPSHTYPLAGTYPVCLVTTNSIGCTDSICSDVIVLPRDIQAPNVFTPNGDGTNDVLVFNNLEHYPNSMLQVYDRWGVLVYENGNYLNDWNGKKLGTGSDCVDGTYYYILSGPLLKEAHTGFVQMIRGK